MTVTNEGRDSQQGEENGGQDALGGVNWEVPSRRASKRGRRHLGVVPDGATAPADDPNRELMEGYRGYYSPHNFYTRAADSKGHSYQMALHLPSHFAQVIAELKESYPEYANNSSVARDAIMHLVALRNYQLEKGFTERWIIAHHDGLAEAHKETIRAKKQLVMNFREACELAEGEKDWKQLGRVLEDMEKFLNESNGGSGDGEGVEVDSPYYREIRADYERYSQRMRMR